MHELGISRNIVAIVGEAAGERCVRRVTCEIGKLSGVIPESLLFCFDAVTAGTKLEGAALDIREIEGRAHCRACSAEFTVSSFFEACACGSRQLAYIAGEELNVKSMELDEVA